MTTYEGREKFAFWRPCLPPQIDSRPQHVLPQDDVLAVEASDVTDEFAARLLEADYGSYAAAPMELRRCVVERGYAVRDALAAYATALNVIDDCSPWHPASHVPFPYRAEP